MKCFMTFLVLLVTLLFVTGAVARAQSRRARRKRAYLWLAKRFSGTYYGGGIFRRSRVRITHGEAHAILSESNGEGPYATRGTQIVIDWPDRAFRCEVVARPAEFRYPSWRKLQDIPVGDPDFDSRFLVRGTDRPSVSDFFRKPVCWHIEQIRRLTADDSVYLLIRRGRILIQTAKPICQGELLEQFVEQAFAIYDQAMLTRAKGIQFVGDDEAQPLEHVVCRVCGEEIVDDMVFCRRCKTPHHADCWHFNGVCSIYGCGETRYLIPQPASTAAGRDSSFKARKPR